MRLAPLREAPKLSFNNPQALASVGTKSRSAIGVGSFRGGRWPPRACRIPRCQRRVL